MRLSSEMSLGIQLPVNWVIEMAYYKGLFGTTGAIRGFSRYQGVAQEYKGSQGAGITGVTRGGESYGSQGQPQGYKGREGGIVIARRLSLQPMRLRPRLRRRRLRPHPR